MKSSLLDSLKFVIGWPIALISLFFIFKIIEPRSGVINSLFTKLNPWILFVSVICFLLYFIFRAYIWKEILNEQKYKIPFKQILFYWEISELKRYTPGNIWSIIGRVVSFGNLGVKKETSVKSMVYEAEFLVLGGLALSLFSLPIIFNFLPDLPGEIIVQPAIYLAVLTIFSIFIFNLVGKRKIKYLGFLNIATPNFGTVPNLKILFFSYISLLFFGMGMYFSTSSIFFINPQNFIILSSFFAFSLLVGYLSLITPTGLGVREGVIILGLSQFLPVADAAISSIFGRVIFIFSELIFIFLVWFYKNNKNKIILKAEMFAKSHKYELILTALIIAYVAYFTFASFLRYDNFYTGRFDLGNMDQTVWNTLHGRIFELTNPNGTNITSRLAFHADFILILLTPFYYLWKDPKMLLLIQSIILPLGAVFVYLISKDILKNKDVSLILAFCYLINPAVDYANLFDFHPVVLATTFLLAAFYYMIKKRYFLLAIFLILAGLTKEEVWLVTSLFGLYLFLKTNKKLLGIIVAGASLYLFYFLVFQAIPSAAGAKHFALSYYSDFGDSNGAVIKNIVVNPIKTFSTILRLDQLQYIKQVLFPFAFLPVLSIFFLFAIPDFMINLLSNNKQLHEIYFQYTSIITPFLFISSIYFLKRSNTLFPNLKMAFFTFVILVFSIYSAYDYGPLPGSKNPNVDMFSNTLDYGPIIDKYLNKIPKRYSVAADNSIGAHLSHRQRIYTIPNGVEQADYVTILLRNQTNDTSVKVENKIVRKLANDQNYFVDFKYKNFISFRKVGI